MRKLLVGLGMMLAASTVQSQDLVEKLKDKGEELRQKADSIFDFDDGRVALNDTSISYSVGESQKVYDFRLLYFPEQEKLPDNLEWYIGAHAMSDYSAWIGTGFRYEYALPHKFSIWYTGGLGLYAKNLDGIVNEKKPTAQLELHHHFDIGYHVNDSWFLSITGEPISTTSRQDFKKNTDVFYARFRLTYRPKTKKTIEFSTQF